MVGKFVGGAGRGGQARSRRLRTFHVHDGPVGHLLPVRLLAALLPLAVRLLVGHYDDGDAPVAIELPQLAPLGRRVYVRLFYRRDIETARLVNPAPIPARI